jgi:hypothetical protein
MSSGAPREIGTTIKYPSVALLCVDSSDQQRFSDAGIRIDDNTPSQIYINRGRPMIFGYVTRLALTEMDVVWDTPNINQKNNTLTIAVYGMSDATPPVYTAPVYIRAILTPNFYDNEDLATELQSKISASISAFGLSSICSITVGATLDGRFDFNQTSLYPSGRPKTAFSFVNGSANSSVTGFSSEEYDALYTIGIAATAVKATRLIGGVAPMCYTPYVDVVSNLLTKNQNVVDGVSSQKVTSSKLARIYFSNENIQNVQTENTDTLVSNMIGTKPFLLRREFKFPKQILWNATENVDVIDIQVLDYKGNPVFIEPVFTTTPGEDNLSTVFQSANTVFRFTLQATEV